MSQENVEIVEGLFSGAAGADKETLLAASPCPRSLFASPPTQ
jgi:hypothetical protein